MANKPLLDLSTDADVHTIKIDGTEYPLRNPEIDMSLVEGGRLFRIGGQLDPLANKEERTDEENAEYARLLRECCALVLDAPPAVQEKLSDPQRVKIAEVFSMLSRPRLVTRAREIAHLVQAIPAVPPEPTPVRTTGAKRSRGSSASTVGRRIRG